LVRIYKGLFLLRYYNLKKLSMKKIFATVALFAIILSVASSCRGKRETCPAYGSKTKAVSGTVRPI
jgi:hypothetical protein